MASNGMNKNTWIKVVVVLAVLIVLGLLYSSSRYNAGYEAAIADIKAQQAEAGDKAAKAAADEANPFKVENPLQGVEANPFEKA